MSTIQFKNTSNKKQDPVFCLITGIAFLIGAIIGLRHFEGMANTEKKITNFISQYAISISDIQKENNGKLVIYSAVPKTTDTLRDDFIQVNNTIVLKRVTEAYEYKKNSTSSTHRKSHHHRTSTKRTGEWKTRSINVDGRQISSAHAYAQNVSFDKFSLHADVIKAFPLTHLIDNTPIITGFEKTPQGYYYPLSSNNGRNRMYYLHAEANTPYTIVARQIDNSLQPFPTKVGNVVKVVENSLSKAELITYLKNGNTTQSTLIRVFFFFAFNIASLLIISGINSKGCLLAPVLALFVETITILTI